MTVTEENKLLWKDVCASIIEGSSSPERVSSLLSDAVLEHFDENGIVLAFSNDMKKGGIDRSYIDDIKDALYFHTERSMEVKTIVDKSIERPNTSIKQTIPQPQMPPVTEPSTTLSYEQQAVMSPSQATTTHPMYQEMQPQVEPVRQPSKLHTYNLKYTFENFVVGESNNFAYTAALGVAENPGSPMRNPLFIYGNSGLGKTHLLCAIDNYITQYYPTKKTIYVQAKDIVNDVMQARIESKNMGDAAWEAFRQKYNRMDIIMVDDIQFLENKEESTEQIFQIFNSFIENDKQVVISADRTPKEINMDERMRSRFNQGLTIDIQPPTFETKLGIIRQFAQANFPDMVLSDDICNYIVEISNSNIRDIEGAIKKVGYYNFNFGREITRDIVQSVLKDHFPDKNNKRIEISFIQREVEKRYGISHDEMVGKKRERRINNPRQIAMYLSREMTTASYPDIGKKFNRDHSTIMHGVENIEEQISKSPSFYNEIRSLTESIREKA